MAQEPIILQPTTPPIRTLEWRMCRMSLMKSGQCDRERHYTKECERSQHTKEELKGIGASLKN